MRTLIFTPVTFNLAETTRMISIASALGPGWRAIFQVYEDTYVHLIRTAGFTVRQLGPVMSPREQAQAMAIDQGRSLRHPFSVALVRERVRAERQLIRECGAEGVVMGTNVTSLLSARAERVPLFYAVPFALTRPHVRQTSRIGLVPGDRASARGADRVASSLLRLAYDRLPIAPRSFRIVAAENGVPPVRTGSEMFAGDVNLLTVMASELEGYRLPRGYVRVGPIFAELPGEVPSLVQDLASEARPLVYLALGSSGNRQTVLRAAHALACLDVNVVAPVRQYLTPADVAGLPSRVHALGLLPAHLLGGFVDAAVLHGGQGTVQTACATGVPFVGMGMQPEQVWNVLTAQRQGNAIASPARRAGTAEFVSAVRKVLHDPDIRRAADRERELYAAEDGPAAAVRAITQHLG